MAFVPTLHPKSLLPSYGFVFFAAALVCAQAHGESPTGPKGTPSLPKTAGSVLFVPGSVLTLGAGIMFGVLRGSIIASIGATAAILIARYLAREWVAGKIAAHPKFAAVDQAVAAEGWKKVALIKRKPSRKSRMLGTGPG